MCGRWLWHGTRRDLDLGEQGMVRAHADIKAGMPGGAALTRNDVAGNHELAAERLDAEALARESRPLRDEPPAFL